MKYIFPVTLFILIGANCFGQQRSSSDKTPFPLHDTISNLDSLLFEAYNNCRLAVFDSLMSENIEFYHDLVGLSTSKTQLVQAVQNNICGKVQRVLRPGSIEVYEIPGFGAIQFGLHGFINSAEPPTETRFSKFVHTWKRENGGWKLYRVISLH